VSGISEDRIGIHAGALTISENVTEAVTGDLLTLTLRATESGTIAQMVDLTSGITKAEAYVGAGFEKVGLQLQGAGEAFSLGQNEPNPFRAETVINYVLPQAETVKLTLLDVTGKVLREIEAQGERGANQLKLDVTGMKEAGDNVATRHMIVIE